MYRDDKIAETFPRRTRSTEYLMRQYLALSLIALAPASFASDAENLVRGALSNLARQPAIHVSMSGYEQMDRAKTSFSSETTVKLENRTAYLESQIYTGGKLVRRVVADGENLWSYDLLRREYSCVPYTEAAASLGAAMARPFSAAMTGHFSALGQLISDIYVRAGANWRPMIGLSQVSVVDPTPTNPTYQVQAVSNVGKTGPQVTAYYDISQTSSAYGLESLGMTRRDFVGQQPRTVSWHMVVVWDAFDPKDADFSFVPPKGARSITVGPKVR